ncbi:MAG TPA: gamma-glutamyl-gamma-aminobutyrate hydrolase family protein [Acidimicrobiales bacterium]|nr:gamma-glutamyl-gamma-aminobutyrate hydrolase family protein [Acidimicrobiales bacterium]
MSERPVSEPGGGARPVVGLSTYETEASWPGRGPAEAALLPMPYLRHVVAAGGAPVLLPPIGDAGAALERLDALVVTGGPDVDPQRYGAVRAAATQPAQLARDAFEAALLAGAAERHLPTLCICRGYQLLNVVRGGTLHQHLPDLPGRVEHSPAGIGSPAGDLSGDGTLPSGAGRDGYVDTPVHLDATSRLAGILSATAAVVACHHHQAVDRPGAGLVPVAWAPDGTIEALEDADEPHLVAVQWHPEQRDDPAVFNWLIGRARRALASR